MQMDPNKSLSRDPLLLESSKEAAEQHEQQQLKMMRQHSHAKAFYLFMVALVALSLGGLVLFHVLPSLLSLLHCFWDAARNSQQGSADEQLAIVMRQFEEFERSFAKKWASSQERAERLRVFTENVRQIEQLNARARRQGRNVTFGINAMADMTEQEMRQMLLPRGYFRRRRQSAQFIRHMNPALSKAFTARASSEEGDEYPLHLDWRDRGVVTPVKAQGMCGSCWAFAAVATTESAYAVAHGVLRNLSEQVLMDCDLADHACKGGNEDKAFRFIHETGLVTAEEYPYVAQRQNVCMLDEGSKNLTKIDVAVFLNPDEQSMLDWLVNFGPVNVGISVPADMKPYKSGVYWPSDFDCQFRVLGDHSMLVVGYGQTVDGQKYWIAKNSWGAQWGQEHGYLNFIRGINACGIEDEPIGVLA